MPINKNIQNNSNLLLRYLDCSVREDLDQEQKITVSFFCNSARGVFFEGKQIYETLSLMKVKMIVYFITMEHIVKRLSVFL